MAWKPEMAPQATVMNMKAPDGRTLGMHVGEVIPQFRNLIGGIHHDTGAHTHGHDDEADAEDGIDLADDLVDGNEGGNEVVHQYNSQPEGSVQPECRQAPASLHSLTMSPAGPTANTVPTMTSSTTEKMRMTVFMVGPR